MVQAYACGSADAAGQSNEGGKPAVRGGYGRPSTTSKAKGVYRTNHSRLDRDNDGTACEA